MFVNIDVLMFTFQRRGLSVVCVINVEVIRLCTKTNSQPSIIRFPNAFTIIQSQ